MDVADEAPPPGIDTSRPHPARTFDYMLGGRNNFAADRAVVDRNLASYPAVRTGPREGVVLVSEWRREGGGPLPTPAEVSCYGGVARKR